MRLEAYSEGGLASMGIYPTRVDTYLRLNASSPIAQFPLSIGKAWRKACSRQAETRQPEIPKPVVGQFHVNSAGSASWIGHTLNVNFKLTHYPKASLICPPNRTCYNGSFGAIDWHIISLIGDL
jgi:hypothetical protein